MIKRHFFTILVCALVLSCPLVESPEDEVLPLTPDGLVVGNPTVSSLFISWQKSEGAESYQLCRDTAINGNYMLVVYDGVSTNYTNTNLQSDCTYYYKVKATNSFGSSPLSGSSSGKTNQAQIPPPVPAGLTVSNPTTTSLFIVWNSTQTATSYRLYRDTNATGSYSLLVYSGSNTNYTSDGLASGTTYFYKIQAINASGSSPLSEYASGTTLVAGSPPAIPNGLTTGSSTTSSILVSWNPSLGATSYEVYRDTDPLGLFSLLVYNGSFTSFYNLNLSSGTEYYYKVRATNIYGSSPLSNHAVGGTLPFIPSGLSVGSPTRFSLHISWSESQGAGSYQIYRDTKSNGLFLHLSYNGTSTDFTDTELASNTTYYYKVRATNPYGSSPLSFHAWGTTLIAYGAIYIHNRTPWKMKIYVDGVYIDIVPDGFIWDKPWLLINNYPTGSVTLYAESLPSGFSKGPSTINLTTSGFTWIITEP